MQIATKERGDDVSKHTWVRLDDLPPGFLFLTQGGILAVKSEYHYSNGGQWRCILLASGEYAHFEDGNDTLVMALEVAIPKELEVAIVN